MSSEQFSHIDLLCPLFIPGNRVDMLGKAGRYSPSAFIPDLEDSVPMANKGEAREATANALPSISALGRPVIPRVNSLPTGMTMDDLETVIGPNIVGISIGKVNGPSDVRDVDEMIAEVERNCGLVGGSIRILPWLETARAIVKAYEICTASKRVRWVAFGAEDFSADMGINREVDVDSTNFGSLDEYGEASLLYARSAVAVAARAAEVQALDTPYVKFRDQDGLKSEAGLARRLGYTGKFAIHPGQIEGIQMVFAPSQHEIHRAEKILEAAREAERIGHGSLSFDGEMIDAPVVARAMNILARAGKDKND